MKAAIWLAAGAGGFVGSLVPGLWGDGGFSPWAIIFSAIGGIAGIVVVHKLYQAA